MRGRHLLTLLLLLLPTALRAQGDEGSVEIFASILAAEDARHLDETMFRRALADPDSSVRKEAVTALGRIRDPAAIPLLTPLLRDPDSLVQATTVFALGLIGDSSAAPLLMERAREGTPVSGPTAMAMITAAARMGGSEGARFLGSVFDRSIFGERGDLQYLVQRAALESWRLGDRAPVDQLMGLTHALTEDARFAAIYSLGRLRIRSAANRLVEALTDRPAPTVRAAAARSLTRAYVDSAGLSRETVADLLVRATRDEDAGVRSNAVHTLAGYKLPRLATPLLPLLSDPNPNVQVEAAHTLGQLGGTDALPELTRILASGRGSFARRREAMLSLALLDSTAFAAQVGPWASDNDWRERATAATAWATIDVKRLARFLDDPDSRVTAAALQGWSDHHPTPDADFVATCRKLLTHRDAAVRSLAADGMATATSPADIPALIAAYTAASRDSFPDAALSALRAMVAIADAQGDRRDALERQALTGIPAPGDYLIRRWAEESWPAAADAWGAAYPLETHRTMEDYRAIARRFLIGPTDGRYPHVKVDLDQLGTIELSLYGPDAPLTVANFLSLVDRHYFDGQRFHRVVSNFVAQAGDPRGDGWGGPGGAIRDEINQRRYKAFTLGMALSGPDTGGSQWFITLSPQPHLDGGYTIFGEVYDGIPALLRVTQGDLIRTIHR
jgi:cyclophilin family peptidyl-prolyl cis-trans isomerase/HEAT repeat protein